MKYLQIDNEGNILSLAEPAEGFPLTAPENSVALDSSVEVDLQNHYWDSDLADLAVKPPQPSRFYFWANKQWNLDSTKLINEIKAIRNRKLLETDWTQMPDSPLTSEQQAAWALYRQELRDLPSNLSGNEVTLDDVTWPVQPALS